MKINYPINDVYSFLIEEILQAFQINDESCIIEVAAAKCSKQFGLNSYEAQKQKSICIMILQQLTNPIMYLLFGVAVSF